MNCLLPGQWRGVSSVPGQRFIIFRDFTSDRRKVPGWSLYRCNRVRRVDCIEKRVFSGESTRGWNSGRVLCNAVISRTVCWFQSCILCHQRKASFARYLETIDRSWWNRNASSSKTVCPYPPNNETQSKSCLGFSPCSRCTRDRKWVEHWFKLVPIPSK